MTLRLLKLQKQFFRHFFLIKSIQFEKTESIGKFFYSAGKSENLNQVSKLEAGQVFQDL